MGQKGLAGGSCFGKAALVAAATASLAFFSKSAEAQQKTMYLDRITMAGAPDDGIAVWRPYMAPRSRFFGQMALGFALNPLRLRTISPPNNAALGSYSKIQFRRSSSITSRRGPSSGAASPLAPPFLS